VNCETQGGGKIVALVNREQVSLYAEAKSGLSSLAHQVTQGAVGLLVVLLLTGGAPSGFALGLTFFLGVTFFSWKEKQRLEQMKLCLDAEDSDASLMRELVMLEEKIADLSERSEFLRKEIEKQRKSSTLPTDKTVENSNIESAAD
jgi:hypothetical protein